MDKEASEPSPVLVDDEFAFDDVEGISDEHVISLSSYDWVEGRRYWFVLFHVALTVIGLVCIALMLLSSPGLWKMFNHTDDCMESSESLQWEAPSNRFTFEDMFTLSPSYPLIRWVRFHDGDAWIEKDVVDGKTELTRCSFPSDTIESESVPEGGVEPTRVTYYPANEYPQNAEIFIISPDGTFILFGFDRHQIYRHSYFANWKVCEISNFSCKDLTEDMKADIRYVQWSNDNMISYVRDNDLWIVTDISSLNLWDSTKRITNDGEYTLVLNGAADWAYEEEVFESAKANYWSPNSAYIAYVKFHQEPVLQYNFTIYHQNATYPELYKYKYPCAGEKNSVVSLWIYDLVNDRTMNITLPNDPEQYVSYLEWSSEGEFGYQVLNRLQQHQDLFVYSVEDEISSLVISEDQEKWIDPYYEFLAVDGDKFIVMQPRANYKHFLFYQKDGTFIKDLNEDDQHDVESIVSFNEEKRILYFTSHSPTPSDLNLFSVDLDSYDVTRLTEGEQVYSAVSFSPSSTYFALYSYGIDIPSTSMVSASSFPNPLFVLEDNEGFKESMEGKAMPTRKYLTVPSADGSEDLNTVMYLPPGFDESEDKEYPALFFVYGGPDSQQVNYSFELGFWYLHSFLASSMGVVVVSVDNRGTCCKGQEFLKQTYLQLGGVEVDDQLSAMQSIGDMHFIDSERMMLWGWSYGGYMASRVVSAASELVRGTISVSPVTDWRFYDSIYTERYMQTPDENPSGYDSSSVLKRAGDVLEKSSYLLVHGTADDNVHFQNSADWVTAMVAAGVDFETMYYPDKTHSLLGLDTRIHLWRMFARFLATNFDLPLPDLSLSGAAKSVSHVNQQTDDNRRFTK